MSEQFTGGTGEKHEQSQKPDDHIEHVAPRHEAETVPMESEAHGTEAHVHEALKRAESHAASKHETHQQHTQEKSPPHPMLHGLREKEMAWSRSMTRTRKQLPLASRAFSRIVHNSAIESISEAAGKTIARPSSMLGGALCAFLGTASTLWLTNHYGYRYNFLLVILLFVSGAVIGLIIEFIIRSIRQR